MTAENLEPIGEAAPSVRVTPGVRLRQAREAMGQSAADIATRLRMGVKQVQALEAGDYAALPTGTFLRGFVRNYAKVVGLDPAELVACLEDDHAQARAVQATPVVEPSRQKMAVRDGAGLLSTPQMQGVAIALVMILLGAAVAYWWTHIRTEAPRAATTPVASPAPARSEPTAESVRQPDAVPANAAPAEAVVAPAQADVQPAPVDTPPAPAAPVSEVPAKPAKATEKPSAPDKSKAVEPEKKVRAADSSVVGFTFSGESWVEVADANGRVVLSKRFRNGDAEEVGGKGPLSIVIGNASNTRMALNGLEFDLTPHTRGNVARVNAK